MTSPAHDAEGTRGLRQALDELAADFRSEVDWSSGRSNYGDNRAWEQAAERVEALLAAHPPESEPEASEVVEYVVGFAFDTHGRVALIRKNRPAWQAGRLNGIGGHVETACTRHDHINSRHDRACYRNNEEPLAAMVREFEEETGCRVEGWDRFVVMDFPGARIHFYRTRIGTAIMDGLHTTTDEVVVKVDHRSLGQAALIPNLTWLIPLAAYTADTYEQIHVKAAMAEALSDE